MLKRIFYGFSYSLFVIYFLYLNNTIAITIFSSVISALACEELLKIMKIQQFSKLSIITLLYSIFGVFSNYLSIKSPLLYNDLLPAIFFIYTITIFILILIDKNLKFKTVSKIHSISTLIMFSLSHLIKLQNFTTVNYSHSIGNFWVLIALLIAWSTDIGAYFSGTLLGKHKLCKEISPKKTIEGFIGGIIFCITTLEILVLLSKRFIFPEDYFKVDYLKFLTICFIGSLIATLGDLSFSFIKRSCHVKDFGNLIPGHGGILDRFDSVIFVVPYFYFALKYLKIFT